MSDECMSKNLNYWGKTFGYTPGTRNNFKLSLIYVIISIISNAAGKCILFTNVSLQVMFLLILICSNTMQGIFFYDF